MSIEEAPGAAPYTVQQVRLIVKGVDTQVREFTVAPDENIPWHYHTNVTDWCYCLEGVVSAETRNPATAGVSVQYLKAGESCRIDAGVIHRLANGGKASCRYLLVQSGGNYDFNQV
jgi:quercetin dioxygenase-like cupin family protein